MRVILLQDVKNLGKRGEVKNVSAGFARNFLLPNGLIKIATKGALKMLEVEKEKREVVATKDLKKTGEMASALDGYELILKERMSKDSNSLYASVTDTKIAKALKQANFEVSKNNVKLKEPIKEMGEYSVPLVFDHNLEAEIKLIIEPE